MKKRYFLAIVFLSLIACTIAWFASEQSFLMKHVVPLHIAEAYWLQWESRGLPADPFANQGDAAFLDQPVPFDWTKVVSYKTVDERIRNLNQLVPKPIIYPDGFVDFVAVQDQESDWDKGKVTFMHERDGLPPGKTLREFLSMSCHQLDLKWKYDPVRDAIATNFLWYRSDPRTTAQLAKIVSSFKPMALSDFYVMSHENYAPNLLDPWRVAFDALVSNPQNFSRDWQLRFRDDENRERFYIVHILDKSVSQINAVDNLFAGKLRDAAGLQHVVVVNQQPPFVNLGSWSITYYVFDLDGNFEQGGMFEGCHRGADGASAWTNWNQDQLTLRGFFNGTGKIDQHFTLTKNGLVLQNVTTDFDQGIMPPSEYAGLRLGISLMHVPN